MKSIHLNGEVSQIAADAQAALGRGDTEQAAALFRKAGERLEAKVPSVRGKTEKDLIRFLAASQYYHGGHYKRAEGLSRKVQANLLPGSIQPIFERFRRDLRERCNSRYTQGVRKRLTRALQTKDFQKALEIMQDHPYVLSPGDMAILRGWCCENLGDGGAAALFFTDSLRFQPDDPQRSFVAAAYTFTLLSQGNLADAWSFVEFQLAAIRHAVPHMIATVVRYHQALQAAVEEKRKLTEDQLRHFRKAWELYRQLPEKQKNDSDMRSFMALCLEDAAFGSMELGDREGAIRIAEQAVDFDPSSASARIVRGIATYPSAESIRDFREAIRLDERNYFPYYCLAHAAFMKGRFEEAVSLAEKALRHSPMPQVKAQLLEMLAIARSYLGHDPEETEKGFAEAQRLDPGNPRIEHNFRLFKAAAGNGVSPPKRQWKIAKPDFGAARERIVRSQEKALLKKRVLPNPAEAQPVTAG